MEAILKALGTNGEIELEDQVLVLRKRGFSAFVLQGSKGDKRIPYSSITAIQLRKPGMMSAGYFQITLSGGKESRGGLMDATKDENTVMFAKGNLPMFEKVQKLVEQRIAEAHNPQQPATAPTEDSPIDKLRKLGELRDAGVVTMEEFEAKKVELLARI